MQSTVPKEIPLLRRRLRRRRSTGPPAIVAGVVVLAACAADGGRPIVRSQPPTLPGDPRLVVPPTEQSPEGIALLGRKRSCGAALAAERYLLDLHDCALLSFGEIDEVSEAQRGAGRRCLDLLRRQLSLDPTADRETARRRLRRRWNRLARRCPAGSLPRRARQLLARAEPPTEHRAALAYAVALKRIRAEGGPLAANARLRLVRWCTRAFRRAARLEPGRQQRALDRCLYPLFDADPAPYFADTPASRPPDPPWTVLRDALVDRLGPLERTRFRRLAELQRASDRAFFRGSGAELPSAVSLAPLRLPHSETGRPLDRPPVVAIDERGYLVDTLSVPAGARQQLIDALRRRAVRAGRHRAPVVVARRDTPVGGLFEVGRAARKLKIGTVYLGVVRRVVRGAPPGDVHARIVGVGKPVWRLEGLPLSVRLLSLRPGSPSRDQPRGMLFHPEMVRHRLTLRVGHDGLVLTSRDGVVARLAAGVPAAALRSALGLLRRAYPDESALIVAPSRSVSYARLVALCEAARFAGRTPLYPALALAALQGLPPVGQPARGLVRRLAAARVRATPPLEPRVMRELRACYRDALRHALAGGSSPPSARIVLEQGARGLRPASPPNRATADLVDCAVRAASGLDLARVSLRFSQAQPSSSRPAR